MSAEPVLMLVTVVSLLVAGVTTVVLMRRLRDDRLRSDARVALLRDLSADESDLLLRPDDRSPDRAEIFQVGTGRTTWVPRLLAAAAVAVAVLAGTWVWTWIPASPPSQTASPVPGDAALELLSLRHTQEEAAFVVTGLVQNPRRGRPLMRVEATVLLFDARGTMVTSGRAPIDFTSLGAGDESPFLIRVPVTGPVARYRVGFRRADGQVLGHVDRRSQEPIAQRQEP